MQESALPQSSTFLDNLMHARSLTASSSDAAVGAAQDQVTASGLLGGPVNQHPSHGRKPHDSNDQAAAASPDAVPSSSSFNEEPKHAAALSPAPPSAHSQPDSFAGEPKHASELTPKEHSISRGQDEDRTEGLSPPVGVPAHAPASDSAVGGSAASIADVAAAVALGAPESAAVTAHDAKVCSSHMYLTECQTCGRHLRGFPAI